MHVDSVGWDDRGRHDEDAGYGLRHADVEATAGAGGKSLPPPGSRADLPATTPSGHEGEVVPGWLASQVLLAVRKGPGGTVVDVLPVVRSQVLTRRPGRRLTNSMHEPNDTIRCSARAPRKQVHRPRALPRRSAPP